MKKIQFFSLITFLLFLVSCGTSNKASVSNKVSLKGTSWQLAESVKGNIPTLSMNEDKISGNAGCNTYVATVVENKTTGEFSIDQISTTRKACRNMQAEYSFISMLKKVNRYQVEDNQLKLYDGKVLLLKFDRK